MGSRLDVSHITFVLRRNPPTELRFRLALHRRVAAVRSVAGWAMLSLASEDEVMIAVEGDRLERPDLDPVDPRALLAELDRCRSRGWAATRLHRYGAAGVAAAVRHVHGAAHRGARCVSAARGGGDLDRGDPALGEAVPREAYGFSDFVGGHSTSGGLGEVSAQVVLCGHSHLPRLLPPADGTLVVNPGSVGCPALTMTSRART